MPPHRSDSESTSVKSKYFKQHPCNVGSTSASPIIVTTAQECEENSPLQELNACSNLSVAPATIYYPLTRVERMTFTTKEGKKVTSHQWAVYDSIMQIPKGKVSTYKQVAMAAGGSARSVGGALRNNPFAPYVPCHRVIASNLFVGGFFGEWGKEHKTGTRYNQKVELLVEEGVHFDDRGHLKNSAARLWTQKDQF